MFTCVGRKILDDRLPIAMTKHLRLKVRLHLVRHSGQTVLNVELERDALTDWCLALCLLKENLIETLIVAEHAASRQIGFTILRGVKGTARTQASLSPHSSQVRMTPNDLDYLLHFFLKYYRDGVAQVDHLDLEAGSGNDDAAITFKVSDAVEPLTAEEARRRLGLH
jgi:hypothetical protein